MWTCLTVMFFSAWSVIHLDTRPTSSPLSSQSLPRKALQLLRQQWKKDHKQYTIDSQTTWSSNPTIRKIIEATLILVFPEYGILKAVEEFTVARLIQHRTREIDGWEGFSMKQAHLVRMGGIDIPQIDRPEYFPHFVAQNAHILEYARFPSDTRIASRSQSDSVDKAIAAVQALYFLSNIAVRNSKFYRLSVLELNILNYIAYASVTFLLRLKKPQELYEAFELDLLDLPSPTVPPGSGEVQHPGLELWIWLGTFVSIIAVALIPFLVLRKRESIWLTAHSKNPDEHLTPLALIGALATFMFMLRRRLENYPWKRSTLLKRITWYFSIIVMYCGSLLYAAYRIKLLVVVFLEFRSAPEGIYFVPSSWTQYIGHVGA